MRIAEIPTNQIRRPLLRQTDPAKVAASKPAHLFKRKDYENQLMC